MKRASSLQNCPMRLMRASGSNVGRAIRAADLFMRAMFMSGRKRRREESVGEQ